MAGSSTSTSRESRGGLSRRAHKAVQGARRSTDDELLSLLGGATKPEFKETPLDGAGIIGSMPKPSRGTKERPGGPLGAELSAQGPPPGNVASWFKGAKSESGTRSTPKPVKAAPPRPLSVAEAVQALDGAIGIDAALSAASFGLPGDISPDEYERIVDEMGEIPNTYIL